MYFQLLLVLSLLLSSVSPFPFYDSPINNGGDKFIKTSLNPSLNENQQELNDSPTENATSATTKETRNPTIGTIETEQPNDLTGQETFYPVGGIWWGIRPWGGWGNWAGYRPWHGWHGWRGPQWGGHWGGHWGGERWGRTSS